jgi:hypothetical protein
MYARLVSRPIAFIDGVDAASLLGMIADCESMSDVVRRWASQLGVEKAMRVAEFFWHHRILVSGLEV